MSRGTATYSGGRSTGWPDFNTLNKTFKLASYPTNCASKLHLKPDALVENAVYFSGYLKP